MHQHLNLNFNLVFAWIRFVEYFQNRIFIFSIILILYFWIMHPDANFAICSRFKKMWELDYFYIIAIKSPESCWYSSGKCWLGLYKSHESMFNVMIICTQLSDWSVSHKYKRKEVATPSQLYQSRQCHDVHNHRDLHEHHQHHGNTQNHHDDRDHHNDHYFNQW